jgi:hypothetical protein
MQKLLLILTVPVFIFVQILGVWATESCAAEKPDVRLQLESGQELFDIEDIVGT